MYLLRTLTFLFIGATSGFIQYQRLGSGEFRTGKAPLSLAGSKDSEGDQANAKKVAIILVDHGSRKAEANDMLMLVAEKYKKQYKVDIVEAAHMELSEPSISTAFRNCIEQGATKIVCHPFFLSRGRHVQEDIPEMMRAAAAEHADIHQLEYSITEPLGLNEKILELIHKSITDVVDEKLLQ